MAEKAPRRIVGREKGSVAQLNALVATDPWPVKKLSGMIEKTALGAKAIAGALAV